MLRNLTKINSKTVLSVLILLVVLAIINFSQPYNNKVVQLSTTNDNNEFDYANISRNSSYDDAGTMLTEYQDLVCNSNVSLFYYTRNYWHPAKVKIISNTWSLCLNNEGSDLDLFVFVWTRASSFKLRQSVRKTWGNRWLFPTMNVAFILGSSLNPAHNLKVERENQFYGDIIQGDFIDSYRNLSFKSLISWRWVKYNCMGPKYFLKIDDDVVLNTPKMLGHIQTVFVKKPPPPHSFSCSIWHASVAIRDKRSKFYASLEEWPEKIYPYYCSGVAYLFTNDLPVTLYNFSFVTKDFWIADTNEGMIARNIKNVKFIDWAKFYYREGFKADMDRDAGDRFFFFEPFNPDDTASYTKMAAFLKIVKKTKSPFI